MRTYRPRLLNRVRRRVTEPLVAILCVAGLLSGIVGDPISAAIILLVVGLSITLDLTQEHKAELAIDALRQSVAIKVDVLRAGCVTQVTCEDVVPGDIVRLKAGDLIPADGIVLSGSNAHANETVLTGEPYPVNKRSGPCPAASPSEAYNALFAGTSLVSGEAEMMVVRTGPTTLLGEIASDLGKDRPPTAFERGIHQLGFLILRVTVFLALFVLLAHLLKHRPMLESFLFAIALAVGLTPELLPMVISVTLARGAMRMSRQQVIVKRLAAIENLGGMDVLCTDKTGTLTEAKIRLERHVDASGRDSQRVLQLAYLNSFFETGVKSPLDEAILAHEETMSPHGKKSTKCRSISSAGVFRCWWRPGTAPDRGEGRAGKIFCACRRSTKP